MTVQQAKKVLIVGGNGFVGGQLALAARRLGHEPAIADMGAASSIPGIPYRRCDITDLVSVAAAIEALRPDMIVNVAAVADIERAERERRLAEAVNVLGAANGAKAAAETGAAYCWFSSDAVFDGESARYAEDSPLGPVNYYGKTKEMGEEAVLKANPRAVIPRLSLVLGFPVVSGNSFLAGLREKLEAGKRVEASTTEVRTPIDVLTLCEAVYELCGLGCSGVVHLGATESASRYELTTMIAGKLGYGRETVVPVNAADAARAPRHRNGILSVARAQGILKRTKLLSIGETVERALTTLREREA